MFEPGFRGNWAFRIGPGDVGPDDVYETLPFRRSTGLILGLIVFLLLFSMPYGSFVDFGSGSDDDSLFSLVFTLFHLFFFLGWSVPIVGGFLVLLMVAFGRETVLARPGELVVKLDLLGFGFERVVDGTVIGNWHRDVPIASSPHSWRGPHLVFATEGEMNIRLGSDLGEWRAKGLAERIKARVSLERRERAVDENLAGQQSTLVEPRRARMPAGESSSLLSPVSLLAANIVPILGVMFLDWRIGEIMLIYWAESAIVGFYNVCKMAKIGGWKVLGAGPFFVGHFGGFMSVHLLFIYALFVESEMENVTVTALVNDLASLSLALLALFVSHGISFWQNFLGRHEYEGKTIGEQMSEPYKRVIVMHVTIIFGGFLSMAMENALPALFLLIILKVVTDMRSHLNEHLEVSDESSEAAP